MRTYDIKFKINELSCNTNIYELITKKLVNENKDSSDKQIRNSIKALQDGLQRIYILNKSIDARHKPNLIINYKIAICTREEYDKYISDQIKESLPHYLSSQDLVRADIERPVIVGFGPAGMFAALVLSLYGLKPIVIERGSKVEDRIKHVAKYHASGILSESSNIQFGEGGAGTFSDGKLFTGVRSKHKAFIFNTFVENGASDEILYDSHPHIGTDVLVDVVRGIRNKIISLGGEVRFDTKFESFTLIDNRISYVTVSDLSQTYEIKTNSLILAIGNASRDTFRYLHKEGVNMESKPFAIGVRIEHLRKDIDFAQYGVYTDSYHELGAASYKLAVDTDNGSKLYTFCMCPGGEVVASSSEANHVVTNGMSNSRRDGMNSNSALLVPVSSEVFGDGVLSGIEYQERIESLAYELGGSNGYAPFCYYRDLTTKANADYSSDRIMPSYRPGVRRANLSDLYDENMVETITNGISKMGRRIKGFDADDAIITFPETRTSSPVRIVRDRDSYESTNIKGLFPCGEGAGYAGGITSSAIDGVNTANMLYNYLANNK